MATAFYRSEKCFRRYEKVIAAIVGRYPNSVTFKCTRRSPATDAARLADAMNSFRTNNWTSSLVDRKKFVDEVYRNVEITPLQDRVTVGAKTPPQVEVVETTGGEQCAGSVAYPSPDQIMTAINAVDLDVVTMPIELTDLTPDQITMIEAEVAERFNIALRKNGNSVILI